MPSHLRLGGRSALALTTAGLAVAGVVTPAVVARAQDQAQARATAVRSSPLAGPAVRRLLLLNGDQLVVRQAGAVEVSSLIPAPDGGSLIALRLGGVSYDVPADALPYFGRGLDPSLFSPALLAAHESGGRLPLRISYQGSVPALPGVTITSRSGGVAAGYLTLASARVFGAALFRQFAAQHARGSYSGTGMFAGGASIALAGVPVRLPLKPQFPMHTLTVTATNIAGKPDSGDTMFLYNVDNQKTFGDPFEPQNLFFHGTAKYSVPAGHYWAFCYFFKVVRHKIFAWVVVVPQLTVSRNRTLAVAARMATSKLTFTVPRPAVRVFENFAVLRIARRGLPVSVGAFAFQGSPIWVSPIRTSAKALVGSIQSFTTATLKSPAGLKGTPYGYNLDFRGTPGLIPRQHFPVTSAELATVHERYFQSTPSAGDWSTAGGTLRQLLDAPSFSSFVPLRLPVLQDQYLNGGHSVLWATAFEAGGRQVVEDNFHSLLTGTATTENWNDYPLHPQPAVQSLTGRAARKLPEFPTVSRTGNVLSLNLAPFSDNDRALGHRTGGSATSHLTISQNGKVLDRHPYSGGIIGFTVSAKPATIALSLRSTLPRQFGPLSSQASTTWSFRTAPAPGARVPRSWSCAGQPEIRTQKCSVPDLLTLNYLVSGLALDGMTPAGQQAIAVAVGNAEPSAPTTIVRASAQLSFDGGRSFQPAAVTRTAPGAYKITFSAPAGVDVTTRFTAIDSKGSSITETITNGYGIEPQA